MSEPLQYVTNQDGERIGVLLDLQTYQQLTYSSADNEILTGISLEELQALSESMLSPKAQVELNDLLARNADNMLSVEEKTNLDRLLAQVDQLNVLKTRARYTLKIKGITKVA
ncbi:MAG: hypothetical protein KME60_30245 [Cyanomargarita calcarea GSE-NOS-MK-12-04C]|jgi:hypothetical protein|uniref:Uncharacterized protein n=1 Tax=Cyanomargarita calcarea GSE-NOS-MK-12-04C TaxID=2839659 RepID=A0A951UW40_9CYAN|nr:hypothetical protein [Cyanomargarita calcarea GSE-NOS-MK-12-04C]